MLFSCLSGSSRFVLYIIPLDANENFQPQASLNEAFKSGLNAGKEFPRRFAEWRARAAGAVDRGESERALLGELSRA